VRLASFLVGALLGSGVLAAAEALAQELPLRDSAADTMDFSEKPLQESKVRLPAPPRSENLIPFDMGPTRRGFEHFVDGASLSIGEDGVIRYTLVVKSDMGATNVTYEAIRCVTRERKAYAYGRKDGTWAEARDPEWHSIATSDQSPEYVLYSDFFCPGRSSVSAAGEAVAALKNGFHPRSRDETADRLTPLGQ
jgi:hypothetical protein